MKIFFRSRCKVKVMFLQNIVTDLLFGFGLRRFFSNLHPILKEKYGLETGCVTLNTPKVVAA